MRSKLEYLCLFALLFNAPFTTFAEDAPIDPNRLLPLGGPENEARLRALIKATIAPKPPGKQISNLDAELPWSETVNGLKARIEFARKDRYGYLSVMVRLKNVSNHVMNVPVHNPNDLKAKPWFAFQIPDHAGVWISVNSTENHTRYFADSTSVVSAKTGFLELAAGEDVLTMLEVPGGEKAERAGKVRAVMSIPKAEEDNDWVGTLEIPEFTILSSNAVTTTNRSLPFAVHGPIFRHWRGRELLASNGSGMETELFQLLLCNLNVTDALQGYPLNEIKISIERRMLAEKDASMKLLLAAIAARAGSEAAANHILDAMKSTQYAVVREAHDALAHTLYFYQENPPDWIVELALTALSDERQADLENTNWSADTRLKISYLADEYADLPRALGRAKAYQATSTLCKLIKEKNYPRGLIDGLGYLRDERAIPTLIEALHRTSAQVSQDPFKNCVRALAGMKNRDAVPDLIKYIYIKEVIEAMEQIGDPRAIEPLQELFKKNSPNWGEKELVAAKLALLTLQKSESIDDLVAMLQDKKSDQFQRRSVVWHLGDHPDPRAIPHLIQAIKTDPSGVVVNQAISVLVVYPYKSAVQGLIECFDAKFEDKHDWKRARTPEMFHDNIAETLRVLTGENYGPDKAEWQKWYDEKGKSTDKLK